AAGRHRHGRHCHTRSPELLMTFTPTPEQQLIVTAASETKDNLLVSALAGAAKTSTLVLIAEALPRTEILCLAFNKKIQLEMQRRLPPNCKAKTLNGLGHGAWQRFIGRRLILNDSKVYDIVSGLINKLGDADKKFAFEKMSEIMQAVSAGKTAGYIPDRTVKRIESRMPYSLKPLMSDADFEAWLDEEPDELVLHLIEEASDLSIDKALDGEIDFNDQILMSTCFPAVFERFPLVLVDEAQDLSALNHAMLAKIVPIPKEGRMASSRIIAVGDKCQSIYGFRGAHEDSMALLQQRYNMTELHLTVSFRCPQAVVKAARWRAPAMQWPEWAIEGTVRHLREWTASDIPDNAAIICRNNAPLFRTAIKLLRLGRYPELMGNDIGKGLVKIMKKFGPTSMSQEEVFAAIEAWKEEKLAKSRAKGSIYDRAACMRVFAEQGDDLLGA